MKNAVSITPWNEEEHIVSVVVHVHAKFIQAVEISMDSLVGVERITQNEQGKYVVLISAATAKKVMQQIEVIQALEGVLNAAMIAHHSESKESLDESIDLLSQSEELQDEGRLA